MKIVCLVGATGTGKTAMALRLAQEFDGAVINFDSRQVYADLPIVTAQPTPEETEVCPHRLYGFLELEDEISAGTFVELAAAACQEHADEGLLPILVGGTGLYLRSLLEGMAPIPDVPPHLREDVQDEWFRLGPEAMHSQLSGIDPDYAGRIHPNDRQRVTRALEVFRATGRTFSEWHSVQERGGSPYEPLKIGLRMDLAELTPRLARRIDLMLEAGALDEVRRAWEKNPQPGLPAWTGIGCSELLDHILGRCTLEEAKIEWLRATRAYAKRQMTWFRKETDIFWCDPGDFEAAVNRTVAFLEG